jgi:hypothetical protein
MRSRVLIALACFFAACVSARASITFEFDGDLVATTANDTIGVPDGMAVFVVALLSGNTFATPTPGTFSVGSDWGGSDNDVVIWSFSTNGNSNFGTNGVLQETTTVSLASFPGWAEGDPLAVYWLPAVSYGNGGGNSTILNAGNSYGTFGYTSSGSDASSWTTPADPTSFYTLAYATPNAQIFPTGDDVGTFGTVTSVPEPAVAGLAAGVLALGVGLGVRRKRA